MAGSRTLKLSILADVDDLKKKLGQANEEVQTAGQRLSKWGKAAGLAFAAAGAAAAAYAGKLLVDGVKSAIEDEKAQASLAKTLENVTGATRNQIAATEAYITKTSLAFGVTDEQLRPSLDRLIRSTKDLSEAQNLQNLALDVAAGSGKSLEAVSNALAKAYEGNKSALGRLGVGLSAAELKTMSMEEVTARLAETFKGQAIQQADTFAGKVERLKIAFDEGKETVGSFVLDAITPLVSLLVGSVIPKISELSEQIGKNLQPVFEKLTQFFTDYLIPLFKEWWSFLTESVIPGISKTLQPILEGLFSAFDKIAKSIVDNKDKLMPLFDLMKAYGGFILTTLAPAVGKVLGTAFDILGTAISGAISLFARMVSIINSVISAMRTLISLIANNPVVNGIGGSISSFFGGFRAGGGLVSNNQAYVVGEKGPELFVPNSNGYVVPNNQLSGNTNVTFNISGAIDPIGVARQINNILNNSATTVGSFTNLGVAFV